MAYTKVKNHDAADGVIALAAAASIWGFFPLYWSLLSFTGAIDILANRIVWSFVVGVIVLQIVDHRWVPVFSNVNQLALLFLASLLLSFNWGISIYAVETNRVIEGGIGMYFAPIFQLVLGFFLFSEKFNRTKWIVLGLSIISATLLIIDLGKVPTIALGMGLSFALYASVKKAINVSSRDSFLIETGLMLLPAILFIAVWGSHFFPSTDQNLSQTFLLIGAGLIAAPPLLLYGFGAQRTTLSTSGMILNFIPILNIVVGFWFLNEEFSVMRAIATVLISVGVFYYTANKRS